MEPGGIPSHPASKPGIPNRATPLPELCRSFNHQASQSWLFQGTGAIQGALNGFPRLHAAVVHTHPSALALPNPFIFAGDPATALEVINPATSPCLFPLSKLMSGGSRSRATISRRLDSDLTACGTYQGLPKAERNTTAMVVIFHQWTHQLID
uniref:Uncharacterized protein n=1 Tax=Bionectria ochroleuca TaxID=29856 RepID=A0A8H7TU65_BIOOC